MARQRWSAWGVCALALALGGCTRGAAPECPGGRPVHVTLRAAERLNPDALGRALPTRVQVLQLASAQRLEGADPAALWEDPAAALGEDLVAHDTLTLDPGAPLARWYRVPARARFVAVVGHFRQPSGSGWRDWVEVPAPAGPCPAEGARLQGPPAARDAQLHFDLEGYGVRGRRVFSSARAPAPVPDTLVAARGAPAP